MSMWMLEPRLVPQATHFSFFASLNPRLKGLLGPVLRVLNNVFGSWGDRADLDVGAVPHAPVTCLGSSINIDMILARGSRADPPAVLPVGLLTSCQILQGGSRRRSCTPCSSRSTSTSPRSRFRPARAPLNFTSIL